MRAKLQVNFDPGQDFFFSGVKTGSMLVCQPCDRTSGNLNRKVTRCLSASRLSLSELFDDNFACVKREKIMRGCGSVPRKCVIV